MAFLKIGINVFIPFIFLFLVFSTWMGYIAEEIRNYYDYKWLMLGFLLAGYILQFYKKVIGLVVVGTSIYIWYLF